MAMASGIIGGGAGAGYAEGPNYTREELIRLLDERLAAGQPEMFRVPMSGSPEMTALLREVVDSRPDIAGSMLTNQTNMGNEGAYIIRASTPEEEMAEMAERKERGKAFIVSQMLANPTPENLRMLLGGAPMGEQDRIALEHENKMAQIAETNKGRGGAARTPPPTLDDKTQETIKVNAGLLSSNPEFRREVIKISGDGAATLEEVYPLMRDTAQRLQGKTENTAIPDAITIQAVRDTLEGLAQEQGPGGDSRLGQAFRQPSSLGDGKRPGMLSRFFGWNPQIDGVEQSPRVASSEPTVGVSEDVRSAIFGGGAEAERGYNPTAGTRATEQAKAPSWSSRLSQDDTELVLDEAARIGKTPEQMYAIVAAKAKREGVDPDYAFSDAIRRLTDLRNKRAAR